ncbi:dihydrofolate reductase family protein [Culicoidibacter larvae]|uniref:Dihydrofolate reductase n=1 Tax=Culicoidibacter larvae TaxID=2579976 RepID=A0A5R8QGS8_9FIRM|nr:dihydrofolate reductase family protein [Culicoidibacter larvae]TLG77241.1 dihydrofolate reductase [Culicoidibacter larvae]
MGKIVLNLAMSLDGYIARKNGAYDWIVGQDDTKLDTAGQLDFNRFLDEMDIIVMGKNSYVQGLAVEYAGRNIVVVANDADFEVMAGHVVYSGDEIIEKMLAEKANGKNIYLFGGGLTIDAFMKADVIDEFIIGYIPTILGEGIPLFYEGNPEIPLHLNEVYISDGTIIGCYSRR